MTHFIHIEYFALGHCQFYPMLHTAQIDRERGEVRRQEGGSDRGEGELREREKTIKAEAAREGQGGVGRVRERGGSESGRERRKKRTRNQGRQRAKQRIETKRAEE